MFIQQKDLFTMPGCVYLAHCISSDFALGAGIARQFAARGVKEELRGNYRPRWDGSGYCLKTALPGFLGCLNLVTKEHYYDKPDYRTLSSALADMAGMVPSGSIIAMPKIGCGLDCLEWKTVSAMISKLPADKKYFVCTQDRQDPVFSLLVAGTRNFMDYDMLSRITDKAMEYHYGEKIHIIEGGASGADMLAGKYAEEKGYDLTVMPAHWDAYGKSAGPIRNNHMHQLLSCFDKRGCLCFWDGKSRGTKQNFALADKYGTPLLVYNYNDRKFMKKNY